MTQDYVHQKLGQDIQSISGTYTPQKELVLEYNGKRVLCVIGMAVVDTACCGSGSFLYATIPGYVVTWKDRQNESGLAVSQVESIENERARQSVEKILRETENINNFNFL
jgi:hypothetical protein